MAEDKGGPPLPRRVPGTKRRPGTGSITRPVLSDSDLRRIRAALDSAQAQVSAPPAELSAPLPQRAPEADHRSEPPAPTPRPAAAPPADPPLVPAQRAPAEEREERQDAPDEEKASPEQETASREETPASPPPPARPRKPGRGRAIITGCAIATLVLLVAGSAWLLTRHTGTASVRTDASTEAAVRDQAAAWVASQVGPAELISCDQAMCQALQAHGVPGDDLVVLKPGQAGPLRSAVVVVTAAARKSVGSGRLTADAPAAIASFGSGAGRIVIGVVFPRGAAAYAAALRKEISDRKTAGSSLLLLGPVTASAVAREQLQGGQVDSRLLLTLAELASRWPVTIMAFGDRAPGASPGVPFRSVDLVVTSSKAGPAPVGGVRLMSGFVRQLGDYLASAHIRTVRLASGQSVVRIEFKAPGRFGLLGTSAR